MSLLSDYQRMIEKPNLERLNRMIRNQSATIARMRTALEQIERWDGFPETGEFWDREKTQPVSYGAQFGSNGERDFMRGIARAALGTHSSTHQTESRNG